jgi:hypothetical protein
MAYSFKKYDKRKTIHSIVEEGHAKKGWEENM